MHSRTRDGYDYESQDFNDGSRTFTLLDNIQSAQRCLHDSSCDLDMRCSAGFEVYNLSVSTHLGVSRVMTNTQLTEFLAY